MVPWWCHGDAMMKGSDFTGFPLMVLLVVVCHIFPSLLGRQIQVDVKLWPHVAVAWVIGDFLDMKNSKLLRTLMYHLIV